MTPFPGIEFCNVFATFRGRRGLLDVQTGGIPLDLTGLLEPLLSAGAVSILYFPTGRYVIRESVEIPEHVQLVFAPGAVLMVDRRSDPTVSLTIRCGIEAGLQQIFGQYAGGATRTMEDPPTSGAIRLLGDQIREVPVEWFGAVPDRSSQDSAPAINAAINAAHRDRMDGAYLSPLPVILSSRYFIGSTLVVGDSPRARPQPGPFLLRGRRGIGGTPSLQALVSNAGAMVSIRGGIAFLIEEIGFFSYDFWATECVEIRVGGVLDASATTQRLQRSVSSIRRCTFNSARDNAVSITTPMCSPEYQPTPEADPMPRILFEGCYFELGDSPRSTRTALLVRAAPQVGVSLVGCVGGGGTTRRGSAALIRAYGGSLYFSTCTFHHDYRPPDAAPSGFSTDVLLESMTSEVRAIPASLTMVQCHSQSWRLLQRRTAVGAASGHGNVVLVNSSCTQGNADQSHMRDTTVIWESNDPVDLTLLACVLFSRVTLSGLDGRVLDIFTNFPGTADAPRGFAAVGVGPRVYHILPPRAGAV